MASSSVLASLELLVVSDDYSTLKMFVRAWRDGGSRIESTASVACARDLIRNRKLHGIVIDMALIGACELIVHGARSGRKEEPIIIACVANQQEERAALAAGANFVVHKPVSTEKIFDLLNLSGAMQAPQRRLSTRYRLIAPVTIFSGGSQYRALACDLSRGGMSIRSARLSGAETTVDFFLEVSSTAVAGQGTIKWSGENGYAGIKFDSVRCSHRLPFSDWLDRQSALLA